MSRVLVKLPGGEGIVHQPGERFEFSLSPNLVVPGGQPLGYQDRYRPEQVWLSGGRCLVGGLLPAGAVSAVVIDEAGHHVAAVVGDGAYAAVIEQSMQALSPAVCCRDNSGQPVRRPLPGEYPSRPVTDAQEPCPACGRTDWEECTPTESWRGTRGGPHGEQVISPINVCRSCGHEEDGGQVVHMSSPDNGDEDEAARAERQARVRAEWRKRRWHSDVATLRAVSFPIYAAESWPAQITGSGSSNDQLTELTIAHHEHDNADFGETPKITVTTSTRPLFEPESVVARAKLEHLAAPKLPAQPEGLSDAARLISSHAERRRRRAATHAAIETEQPLNIDGVPELFVMLGDAHGAWVAIRQHDDLTITVAARQVKPMDLVIEPVPDPFKRLLGPEPTL
jgi:hypothetical protein